MSLIIATFAVLALSFTPAPGTAATADAVSARRPLRGNDTMVSARGKFEVGLFRPAGSSGRFYLGIWYSNIPVQTVIWVANRASPLFDVASAELRVSAADGSLELLGLASPSSSAPAIVWSSNLSSTSLSSLPGSNTAVIRDNGNLVLVDGGNSSNVLWQSFDNPTDTLVPEGWLGQNKLTGEYQTLTSWRNAHDPAPGMFVDTVDPKGSSEFFYLWNRSRTYWRSGVWTGSVFSRLPKAPPNVIFNQTYVETPVYRRVTSVLYDNNTITRMVLDLTGQTKQFIWVPASQSWQLFWTAPTVQCDVYALCGTFGVCDQRSQSSCTCPPGFAPASEGDWTLSDWSGGCRRSSPLMCTGNGSTDGFLALKNVKLPDDSVAVGDAQSEAECESACLKNCSCQAYAFSAGCAVWHGELRNLQQLYSDSGISGSGLYLRLSESELQDLRGVDRGKKGKRTLWLVLGIALAGVAAFGASLLLAWRILLARSSMSVEKGSYLTVYSYADLRAATKNFSERLGGGGFGSVYRGVLKQKHKGDITATQVAVKKLENLRQGDKLFRTEVSTLGRIQHVNLVRLLGFCSAGDDKMLVYEYMPNGSLEGSLFGGDGACLSWRDRYGIMLGVARGLVYLHDGCLDCIIHCDIKPENILLDEGMSPRIADFGMAKLVGRDFSRALTTMRGTIGAKADMYSYGMVLFELISGRRNSEGYHRHRHGHVNGGGEVESAASSAFFPVWAAGKVVDGEVGAVADPRLRGDVREEELERACRVACWCIQDQEAHRPTMAQVV
ncbi:unnamed protein product [Alopecurus aequalis]